MVDTLGCVGVGIRGVWVCLDELRAGSTTEANPTQTLPKALPRLHISCVSPSFVLPIFKGLVSPLSLSPKPQAPLPGLAWCSWRVTSLPGTQARLPHPPSASLASSWCWRWGRGCPISLPRWSSTCMSDPPLLQSLTVSVMTCSSYVQTSPVHRYIPWLFKHLFILWFIHSSNNSMLDTCWVSEMQL